MTLAQRSVKVTLEPSGNRAEYKAIAIAQDHSSVVLQAAKALRVMIEDWMDGRKERHKEHFNKLAKLERKADSIKRTLLDELSVSETMLRRSDYFRLVMRTDDIADLCEASAWDLSGLEEFQPDAKTRKYFTGLLDALNDAVYKMRQAIMFLEQNSDKAVELAMQVDLAERDADSAHRSFTQFLYRSNLEVTVLLRLKDLGQHLEEIADAAEDAADAVRIIAIARVP
jgi:predicted phosphate transport protein (TIGR00153 family)